MKSSTQAASQSRSGKDPDSLKDGSNVVEVTNHHIAILELIAGGAPSNEVFDALTQFVESQGGDLLASLLMLSQDGKRLHCVSAPSLPADYVKGIDRLPVGDNVGSCGTAAFRGEAVYCNDLSTDEGWSDYRDLVETYGFASCWSTPVKDLNGEVLGTLAVYRKQTGAPSVRHQQLLELSTHIASLAIGRHRADEALRMSQQKFALVFENSPDAVLLTTLEEGHIVEANQGSVRMFGFSQEELIGSTLHELGVCNDPQHSAELYEKLRHHSRVAGFHLKFRTSGGEERTALISAEMIALHNGPHVIKICRDITGELEAKRNLQQSRERLLRAQELGHIGDWSGDLKSGQIHWSDEMFRIYGREADEQLTSEKVQSWVHEDHLPDLEAWISKLYEIKPGEKAANLEFRILRPDGEIRWVEVAAGAVFDAYGKIIELCGTALDITARKVNEEAIRQAAVASMLVAALSTRERQVLELVVGGAPNKAVAKRLDIAEKTVEKHRANVMKKLQVHSLPELVRVAIAAGAGAQY